MSDNIESKKKDLFNLDEEEYLEDDNYFKIDEKNTFSIGDSKDSKEKLNRILDDNKEFMEENLEEQKKILSLFYEKKYKTDSDSFNICYNIGKQLKKSMNINKKNIDEKLDYFINLKNSFKYSHKFEFNKENIKYLGFILSYSYSKFGSFKINNSKDLQTKLDKTKDEKIDILMLFFDDCFKQSKSPTECSKSLFCKKNKQNFPLPGSFIFLINSFIYINIIEINFNLDEEKLTKDEINLFIISILNIQNIFPNKITIKINLIHEQLQCSLYKRFYRELFKNAKKGKFKLVYINKDDIYKRKWDFETEFLLEKYRKNKKKINNDENDNNNEKYNLKENDNDDLLNTPLSEEVDFSTNMNTSTSSSNKSINSIQKKIELLDNKSYNKKKDLDIFKSQSITPFSNLKDDIDTSSNFDDSSTMSKRSTMLKSILSNKLSLKNSYNLLSKKVKKPNENYEDMSYHELIIYFKNSLELILLTINSLNNFTNMKRLDLVINDFYQNEFVNLLNIYSSSEENKNFHIVDALINNVVNLNLDELNIETNILDNIAFNKILSFIHNNHSISSLKLSFFSSDVTYSNQSIYKIYYQNFDEKKASIPISEIINLLLPFFIENLEVLFELIKKKDFKQIGVNFDTPDIIEVNNSYMNTIFKFLMNILFLVDNPQSYVEKLTILSPSTKLDSRYLPSIENILEDIKFNENNKVLTELSLHMQLYMIKNIKNLITERLILLNIGDCDIYTFRELTKFLTSPKFCTKSSLNKLSISLLDSIIDLREEIKNILERIFSIKIKQLTELNIYTNISISIIEGENLLNIFKNNWISKCRLILNYNNDKDIRPLDEGKNSIKYLVPRCLENKLLSNDELVIRNKIFFIKERNNIYEYDNDDLIYWILVYYLNKKNINQSSKKDIVFNILKYIYFTKYVEIINILED